MAFYQKIESLTDYVLVDSEHISVEHWSRSNIAEDWRWRLYTKRSESVKFPSLEIELPLEEIYEDLEMLEDWVEKRLAPADNED